MTHERKDNLIEEICEMLTENGFGEMGKVMEILMNSTMKLERSRALGAMPYERTEDRHGYANGFKEREFQTRMGEIRLQIPQVRGLKFYPRCLEKGLRSEKALKVAIAEMYLRGVSTRKVSEITEELCGFEISSGQVSKIAKELDDEVNSFFSRVLGEFEFVYLDGRYEKIRHGGHVKKMAIIWAIGVDKDGRRQVLGLSCKLSEAEVHWRDFLTTMVERGLRGVKLIISDDHPGLGNARTAIFPTVPWQRCVFHILQNANAYIPKKSMRDEVYQDLKDIFNVKKLEYAVAMQKEAAKKYETTAPKLSEWITENLHESFSFFKFPRKIWSKIKTSNVMERFNRELKRRTRVVSIFPNEESAFRLIGALLVEFHEDWLTGTRYMKMEN